ncbi:MAG TPA: phospho-sugar mutase [Candidatus Gallacutalibacter stercoravium]|nr:phospho-sugar mutase [Candidatus Gallacutalibacter stercoravium]
MSVEQLYQLWLQKAVEDPDLISELKEIAGQEEEISDRFYRDLEFGTAGLRGVIGAGTNRMNIYTVRQTTQGLADYLLQKYPGEKISVAIACDSRIKADLFAQECARVLAANGITAHITAELQPTPVLSFLVRRLSCKAGIMITASHNPAKYNGYKCYGPDGCQMTDHDAGCVYDAIQKVDMFDGVKLADYAAAQKQGLICTVEDSVYDEYLDNVQQQAVNPGVCQGAGLKVVYTPLNGAGNKLVRRILKRIGVEDVIVVPEQEKPDGNFPTCPYPNPEFREALELALKLAQKEQPDLVLATDPDSDRVGIAVRQGDGYRLMTGNETGIMLINYILSCRKQNGTLPQKPVAVKTIVTSEMVARIAEKYGCELRNVLTGFKYIGEQILGLEQAGEAERYVFGFEESYGYLAGTYVRDKDAVVASMLICEMAAYYRRQGKLLSQVIEDLYSEFGYYQNTTLNFAFEGEAGMEKMKQVMDTLRAQPPKTIADKKVVKISDYLKSEALDVDTGTRETIKLPKSNVLGYALEGGAAAIVRPSGTEPKIKVYVTSVGASEEAATAETARLGKEMTALLGIE